jgi:hypothetical protein
MFEVPLSCKYQRYIVFVRGLDDFIVSHRSSGFDYRRHTGQTKQIWAISEWEEGI